MRYNVSLLYVLLNRGIKNHLVITNDTGERMMSCPGNQRGHTSRRPGGLIRPWPSCVRLDLSVDAEVLNLVNRHQQSNIYMDGKNEVTATLRWGRRCASKWKAGWRSALLIPQIMFKPLWVYRNMQAGGYSSSAHELQNSEYKCFILTHLWTPGAKCFAHCSVDTLNLEHSTCFSWSNLHDTFCWVSPHLRPLPIVKTTGGTTGGEWSAL